MCGGLFGPCGGMGLGLVVLGRLGGRMLLCGEGRRRLRGGLVFVRGWRLALGLCVCRQGSGPSWGLVFRVNLLGRVVIVGLLNRLDEHI